MTPQERVVQAALNEVGYLEKKSNSQLDNKTANAGSNNYTKYARDLDAMGVYNSKKNGYAWCDIFVDWCMITTFGLDLAMKMTGQSLGSYGAGCTSSVSYYKAIGRYYSVPKIGDQIFFKENGKIVHTGLVVDLDSKRIYTVEGNTSSRSGIVANGGAVEKKSYPLLSPYIHGYGRPKYELVKEEENEVATYQYLKDIPESYQPTIEKLINLGVLKGTGDGALNVDDTFCRVMTVLDRLGKI